MCMYLLFKLLFPWSCEIVFLDCSIYNIYNINCIVFKIIIMLILHAYIKCTKYM